MGYRNCPHCGMRTSSDLCPNCLKDLSDIPAEPAKSVPTTQTCSNCGASVSGFVSRCSVCGYSVEARIPSLKDRPEGSANPRATLRYVAYIAVITLVVIILLFLFGVLKFEMTGTLTLTPQK